MGKGSGYFMSQRSRIIAKVARKLSVFIKLKTFPVAFVQYSSVVNGPLDCTCTSQTVL